MFSKRCDLAATFIDAAVHSVLATRRMISCTFFTSTSLTLLSAAAVRASVANISEVFRASVFLVFANCLRDLLEERGDMSFILPFVVEGDAHGSADEPRAYTVFSALEAGLVDRNGLVG